MSTLPGDASPPKSGCSLRVPPLLMNAMKLAEPASTGAAEMSVFHQLSAGNSGSGPGSAPLAAGTVAGTLSGGRRRKGQEAGDAGGQQQGFEAAHRCDLSKARRRSRIRCAGPNQSRTRVSPSGDRLRWRRYRLFGRYLGIYAVVILPRRPARRQAATERRPHATAVRHRTDRARRNRRSCGFGPRRSRCPHFSVKDSSHGRQRCFHPERSRRNVQGRRKGFQYGGGRYEELPVADDVSPSRAGLRQERRRLAAARRSSRRQARRSAAASPAPCIAAG